MICNQCKIDKDISEFHKKVQNKNGISKVCKTCVNTYHKECRDKPASVANRKRYSKEYYYKMKDTPEYKARSHRSGKNRRKKSNYREKNREHTLKKYGLSLQDYDNLCDEQNGLCLICCKPESIIDYNTKKLKPLAVDHCHITNKVRGLLCSKCNQAIGLLQDSPKLLHNAATYLK